MGKAVREWRIPSRSPVGASLYLVSEALVRPVRAASRSSRSWGGLCYLPLRAGSGSEARMGVGTASRAIYSKLKDCSLGVGFAHGVGAGPC